MEQAEVVKMIDRRKPHVPSWEDVVERMRTEELSGSDFLLSVEGGACTPGEISVFCGSSYFTTLPIVHYLIEQIAVKEDFCLGDDTLVLSRMSEPRFLKRLAFSLAGIDCWQLEHELKAKSVCSEYHERYEESRAKIEASNLSVWRNGVMELEDLDKIIAEREGVPPRMIIIDDLLSCRCRGCNGDAHGWSMVGNRLNNLAEFWSIAIVAMMPVPAERIGGIFEGYGLLKDYIHRACVVRIGNRDDATPPDVCPFVFESHLPSASYFGDFKMKYNIRTHRIFD